MAWERRGQGGRYYYRSVRREGRPCKVYVGHGPAAEEWARLTAEVHAQRQAERHAQRTEQARWAPADCALAAVQEWVQLLATATLLDRGYHWHRGEWRRRRNRRE
jgi:hypothetical protein